MRVATGLLLVLAAAAVLLLARCGPPEPDYLSEQAKEGRAVFIAFCMACHGEDPSKDTLLGPAILGSSEELLLLRVRDTKYPPGYKPKRDTALMVPIPAAVPKVPQLAAFLREFRPE